MLRRFARTVGWQDDARESQESQRLVPVGHGEAEDSAHGQLTEQHAEPHVRFLATGGLADHIAVMVMSRDTHTQA